MTAVTVVGPPESNGGVGQYTSDFADAFGDNSRVRRFDVGPDLVSHLRLAVSASRDDTEAIHIQFVYSFLGPAGVLTIMFFPVLYVLTRLSTKRLVVTLHEVWGKNEIDTPLRRMYAYFVHTLLSVCTDNITFLSENAQNAFHRTAWAEETSVGPHGVNTNATRTVSDARARFGLDEDAVVVSQHGYVNPRKGVETFLQVAKELPEYEFLLAGGPRTAEHEAYFEKVSANAPENVTVTGVLDEIGFHAAFNATDLVMLPYKDINQSGIFNWCAAYALPTIGSEIPYFEDIRQEWGCPVTFQCDDVEQAVDAVKQLCENEDERRELAEYMAIYATENSMNEVVKWFAQRCYINSQR